LLDCTTWQHKDQPLHLIGPTSMVCLWRLNERTCCLVSPAGVREPVKKFESHHWL